jgi:bisphosphoglycerate-dependent phosphoglycerate mutase
MKARRGYYDRPPGGESLHDVDVNRVTPFADEHIRPWLEYNRNKQGGNAAGTQVAALFNQNLDAKFEGIETIAIVAHGNSLRAFLRTIGAETVESIPDVEFDTGVPEVLEFDQSGKYLNRYKLELVDEPAAEPAQAAIN